MPVLFDAFIFCLDKQIGVTQEVFRQEKIVPLVGEEKSHDVINSIRFLGFVVTNDLFMHKLISRSDGKKGTYFVVDVYDFEAKVYYGTHQRDIYIFDIVI